MGISLEQRDRISQKARQVIETGTGERLTHEEENILQEIAGVVYVAYKNAIKILDTKEQGGIENEQGR